MKSSDYQCLKPKCWVRSSKELGVHREEIQGASPEDTLTSKGLEGWKKQLKRLRQVARELEGKPDEPNVLEAKKKLVIKENFDFLHTGLAATKIMYQPTEPGSFLIPCIDVFLP